jgi:pimeloyl-ACP methyl ester carboxylesterase
VAPKLARLFALIALVASVACGGAKKTSAPGNDGPPVAERSVRFRTSDNLILTGRLFGSGRVGVVLAHMIPADATSWYPVARRLAREGYLALAFNFRGYDGSQGAKSTANAPIDLKAARDLVVQNGARSYAFVGASTGGTAAIVSATTLDPLALVVISPPLRFAGLDAVLAAGRLQRPVLIMAAKDDQPAIDSLETLSRALPNPDTKIFDGSAAGTDLLTNHPEAIDAIVTFLQRYAPSMQPTQTP